MKLAKNIQLKKVLLSSAEEELCKAIGKNDARAARHQMITLKKLWCRIKDEEVLKIHHEGASQKMKKWQDTQLHWLLWLVHRERLWTILRAYGIPEKIIRVVKALHKNFEYAFIDEGGNTAWLKIRTRVKKGVVSLAFGSSISLIGLWEERYKVGV